MIIQVLGSMYWVLHTRPQAGCKFVGAQQACRPDEALALRLVNLSTAHESTILILRWLLEGAGGREGGSGGCGAAVRGGGAAGGL